MTDYLLDTNVLSELTKPEPDAQVVEFVANLPIVHLSVITLHELEYGVSLLPEGKRRQKIQTVINRLIERYGKYIIPLGQAEAQQAAMFRVQRRQQGNTLPLADSLIVGTAQVHRLVVATRNTKDFVGLDVEVFNPFASQSS